MDASHPNSYFDYLILQNNKKKTKKSCHLVYSGIDINTQGNKPWDFGYFIELDSNEKLITSIALFEHS